MALPGCLNSTRPWSGNRKQCLAVLGRGTVSGFEIFRDPWLAPAPLEPMMRVRPRVLIEQRRAGTHPRSAKSLFEFEQAFAAQR